MFSTQDFDKDVISEFRMNLEGILKSAMPVRKSCASKVSLNADICECLLRSYSSKASISSKEVADFLAFVLDSNRYSGKMDFEIDDASARIFNYRSFLLSRN